MKEASVEELSEVIGKDIAIKLKDYLDKMEE